MIHYKGIKMEVMFTVKEMKREVHYILEALDESTASADDDMVWLENSEIGILRGYIAYLENKLK